MTVENNVDDAVRASSLALNASNAATRGGGVVHEVVSMMSSINVSSARISDITSIIDSIAFQTNILALNAAVAGLVGQVLSHYERVMVPSSSGQWPANIVVIKRLYCPS